MLIRLILFALAIWLLIRWLLPMLRQQGQEQRDRKPPEASYTDMLPCAWCGTHLARNSAITRNGKHYCSSAHADSAQARDD